MWALCWIALRPETLCADVVAFVEQPVEGLGHKRLVLIR
jgi:hypothetical protein